MLTKDDPTVTKKISDDAQMLSSVPNSPFKLLFQKRQRSVSHPLTRSASIAEIESPHQISKTTESFRGFIPDSTFDRNKYDLRDTGLPGFLGVQSSKRNECIKTFLSEGSESTQATNCNSEPEFHSLIP